MTVGMFAGGAAAYPGEDYVDSATDELNDDDGLDGDDLTDTAVETTTGMGLYDPTGVSTAAAVGEKVLHSDQDGNGATIEEEIESDEYGIVGIEVPDEDPTKCEFCTKR